jgi:NitT/TauT family transport system ATP-binding protein
LHGVRNIKPDAGLHRSARPTLAIRGVSKCFVIGEQTVEALRDINLTIGKGEFVCLIGASGCGKSTLLRIIAGFETASAGAVEMYGAPIIGPGPERGMVFQDFALFPWLTVKQNVGFGPRQRGLPKDKLDEIATRYTDMVGLTKFADYYPSQLSGGMKQRVAIARVLANDCEVLLMDEPFGALDALTREKLQQELLEIWERTRVTVIFVTHSVEEAVVLSDRVVVMTAGPGRIEHDARIKLARPREVSAIDFNQVRRDITRRLTSHVVVKSVPLTA